MQFVSRGIHESWIVARESERERDRENAEKGAIQ